MYLIDSGSEFKYGIVMMNAMRCPNKIQNSRFYLCVKVLSTR